MNFNVRRRFTYELQGRLDASYILNTADNKDLRSVDVDRQTFNITPRVQYDLTNNLLLEGVYRFSWSKNDIDGTDAVRNFIYGGIRARWDILD